MKFSIFASEKILCILHGQVFRMIWSGAASLEIHNWHLICDIVKPLSEPEVIKLFFKLNLVETEI